MSEHKAITSHLERLSGDEPSYYEQLQQIAETLPPMSDQCRIAVNIPAREEGDRIYESLQTMFTNARGQPKQMRANGERLPTESYEISIFDNWVDTEIHDRTSEEIERFMCDYPSIPIRLISLGSPQENANVGFARRLLQDVTCLRSLQRQDQAGPLYISSEDADNEGFDQYALDSYISYLDKHPEAVGARMHRIMNPMILRHVPHLFMRHRMHTIAQALMQRPGQTGPCSPREIESGFCSQFLPPAGFGVAYKARDMLGVGGYLEGVYAEDLSLWLRLHKREIAIGRAGLLLHTLPTQIVTSPRRLIASYVSGRSMYGSAEDFLQLNDAVRQPMATLLAAAEARYPLEVQRDFTQKRFSDIARWELQRHVTPDERWRVVGKLMLGLGFTKADYTTHDVGQEITVQNWEGVEERVRNYTPTRRIRQSMNLPYE